MRSSYVCRVPKDRGPALAWSGAVVLIRTIHYK